MMTYKTTPYATVVANAKKVKSNVEKTRKLGLSINWAYSFCNLIVNPNEKNVKNKKGLKKAPHPHGTYISRQVTKDEYIILAKQLIRFVEKYGRTPNYLKYRVDGKVIQIRARVYMFMFARIVNYYDIKGKLPAKINVNSKAFIEPKEYPDKVYDYFCQKFNAKPTTIDGCLELVEARGYGYYYDDVYSNTTSIDRMKEGKGVNCTDSCHVFYNIMKHFIKQGRYKKVECIHVGCSNGDGHVRLRITCNDGTKIYRDPACTLSDNGRGFACNWCLDGELWAIDPDWFLENLQR